MRRIIMVLGTATILVVSGQSAAAEAPDPSVQVVDDDGAQCPGADHTSIQAAVDAADPGDLVLVCAGTYAEQVVVDEPLTVRGQVEAVAATDCFATASSVLGDLDDSTFAVLSAPVGADGPLLRVSSDDVRITGMVVEGRTDATPEQVGVYTLFDPGVSVDGDTVGVRLDHNLLRLNTLGIELGGGSNRVDANCLRDNRWSVANQRYPLTDARVDHNQTFRTEQITYEIGWGYQPAVDVVLAHNHSRSEGSVFYLRNSTGTQIRNNLVQMAVRGVWVFGDNVAPHITGNVMTGGSTRATGSVQGVLIAALGTARPSTGVVIADNSVTGFLGANSNGGAGINAVTGSGLSGASIDGNVLNGNRFGIVLNASATDNRLRGNTALDNVVVGFRLLAGATGNLLRDNVLLSDTGVDAQDDNPLDSSGTLPNTWVDTICIDDVPDGLIC